MPEQQHPDGASNLSREHRGWIQQQLTSGLEPGGPLHESLKLGDPAEQLRAAGLSYSDMRSSRHPGFLAARKAIVLRELAKSPDYYDQRGEDLLVQYLRLGVEPLGPFAGLPTDLLRKEALKVLATMNPERAVAEVVLLAEEGYDLTPGSPVQQVLAMPDMATVRSALRARAVDPAQPSEWLKLTVARAELHALDRGAAHAQLDFRDLECPVLVDELLEVARSSGEEPAWSNGDHRRDAALALSVLAGFEDERIFEQLLPISRDPGADPLVQASAWVAAHEHMERRAVREPNLDPGSRSWAAVNLAGRRMDPKVFAEVFEGGWLVNEALGTLAERIVDRAHELRPTDPNRQRLCDAMVATRATTVSLLEHDRLAFGPAVFTLARAIEKLGPTPTALAHFRSALQEEREAVVPIRVLVAWGDTASLTTMVDACLDRERVPGGAMPTLASFSSFPAAAITEQVERLSQRLRQQLDDLSPDDRMRLDRPQSCAIARTTEVLAHLGDVAAVPPLLAALQDHRSEFVIAAAAEALTSLLPQCSSAQVAAVRSANDAIALWSGQEAHDLVAADGVTFDQLVASASASLDEAVGRTERQQEAATAFARGPRTARRAGAGRGMEVAGPAREAPPSAPAPRDRSGRPSRKPPTPGSMGPLGI